MDLIGEAGALAGGPAAFALKHWKLVAGGLGVLILGIMLLSAKADARHWHKVADNETALYQGEKTAHAITMASLNGALGQIADNNKRIEAAAAELQSARQQAAADQARANERWQGTQATVTALEADARRTDRKPCTVSDAAKSALEGL